MPRAYADVIGNFRRGEAGAYARNGNYDAASRALAVDDPEASEAYRQRGQQEEETAYRRSYGGDIASGNYESAMARAGKYGDIQGVAAAQQGQVELTQQQRLDGWRELQRYGGEIEAIESDPQSAAQTYPQWLARARQDAADSPELSAELARWPEQYAPGIGQRIRGIIRTWQNRLLTPEQAARQERELAGQGERRYTSASGGILDTYTGNVNRNPYYVRGGAAQEGPPAPPAGYRIVEGN